MPLGMLVAVHGLLGWRATLLLIGTVVVSDSMQYYTGRSLGRHPLAPSISPKKTIEGAVGGVVFGTIFMTIFGAQVLPFSGYGPLVILGLLVVAFGIGGDLFESRLKRTAGLKDSSSLIPGHGGILDRIDALLFAVAPFYLFVRNVT
jgi:phosphatidate cytidylyltransferase